MRYYKSFNSIILIVIGLMTFLVTDSQNIQDSAKNEFSASVNYQSNLHYFGRVDSLKSSGVFPLIGFKSKTGLYLNSTFIFLHNSAMALGYTGTILEGGYRFPYNKNFSGNIYYDHFLYQDKSILEQAALKGQAGINTAYNNQVVNIDIDGDVKFSNKETDFGFTAGLDKLFLLKNIFNNAVVGINPSVYMYCGTHNYFISSKKSVLLGLPLPSKNSTTQQAQQFSVLAYEISVPIVYVKGKFNFYVSPAYVLPKNLVIVANRPDLSERGSDLFYFSAGIGVRL